MRKISNIISIIALCVTLAWLSTGCEKDPGIGIHSVADGKWETPDFLIHNAVTDIDGNRYDAVQIGNQVWIAQNLRTTRYADGSLIHTVPGASYYDGFREDADWGYLYDWKAVVRYGTAPVDSMGLQGICPNGWHVPCEAEWQQLFEYVGGQNQYTCNGNPEYIAKALAGKKDWKGSDVRYSVGWCPGANNATGFSAFPAGRIAGDGNHADYCEHAFFWGISTPRTPTSCYYKISNDLPVVKYGAWGGASEAYSVRCVRNDSTGGSGVTDPVLPTVHTNFAGLVFSTTAACGGEVVSDGGASVTARGVCWSTVVAPTIFDSHTTDGTGTGFFASNITGLNAGTTYHVRAYATNSVGTAYGNEFVFTTLAPDGAACIDAANLTDIDGNTYSTVQIGAQCWMKENLRTTKYADGTPIEQGSSPSMFIPYWYYPNGNPDSAPEYGLLYNGKALLRNNAPSSANPSGIQGVCPDGWHVPSDAEWTQLTDYVGSQSEYVCSGDHTYIAKALATSTVWHINTLHNCAIGNNLGSNNATGFSALPVGFCDGTYYSGIDFDAYFWTATRPMPSQDEGFYIRKMSNNLAYVLTLALIKETACSVRCVRDPVAR